MGFPSPGRLRTQSIIPKGGDCRRSDIRVYSRPFAVQICGLDRLRLPTVQKSICSGVEKAGQIVSALAGQMWFHIGRNPRTPMDANSIYIVCLAVGLLFTIVSAFGSHLFAGHGEVGHFDSGHTEGSGGHAEGGDGSNDMPGFSPLSPTTIAAFVTAFGACGMVFSQFDATRSAWVSAPLSIFGGLAIATGFGVVMSKVFRATQGSSEGRVADLEGTSATVITPIAAGAVGEIAYVQSGSRYSAPARAEGNATFANGATVKITRVVGTQFYVSAS
jgi:hypothetical protein